MPETPKATIRAARPDDFDPIMRVADDWWGRPVSHNFARLFLNHFFNTSLVAEHGGELAGFVVGFLSPAKPDEAYIHFTGVSPDWRRGGLARAMYEEFFDLARRENRRLVSAITSPHNDTSIAFHRAMGFAVSEPVPDYDGPSVDRVRFTRSI